jgi:FtsH-binding integral membrane protein
LENLGKWITGGVIGVIGIIGLFVSSRAADNTFYYLGLIVFAVAIAVIFLMIRKGFDAAGARPRGPGDTAAHNN